MFVKCLNEDENVQYIRLSKIDSVTVSNDFDADGEIDCVAVVASIGTKDYALNFFSVRVQEGVESFLDVCDDPKERAEKWADSFMSTKLKLYSSKRKMKIKSSRF